MKNKHPDSARVFNAFCDENRLVVPEMLQRGEKHDCVLLEKLEISKPALSHRTEMLRKSGSGYAVELPRKQTTVVANETAYRGCCN